MILQAIEHGLPCHEAADALDKIESKLMEAAVHLIRSKAEVGTPIRSFGRCSRARKPSTVTSKKIETGSEQALSRNSSHKLSPSWPRTL